MPKIEDKANGQSNLENDLVLAPTKSDNFVGLAGAFTCAVQIGMTVAEASGSVISGLFMAATQAVFYNPIRYGLAYMHRNERL